jgi:hypothetical protein
MVTYQANPKLLGLGGGGATQGDEGMGTRENIIECNVQGNLSYFIPCMFNDVLDSQYGFVSCIRHGTTVL